MLDDKSVSLLFGNAEPTVFTSKAKLAQEIQKLCDTGIVYFHIPRGKCIMRPEIKIMSDCTIYIKHIAQSGGNKYYHFVLEEVKYESLRFD